METVQSLIERGRALRAEITARMDGVPNLRDYGFERRADFERAVCEYHAQTMRLESEYQEIGRQRHEMMAARRAAQAI